jgi:hypothetical protein
VQEVAVTLRRLGCHAVHLGGGEPFLEPTRLVAVVEAVIAEGLTIEYVETNADWCVATDPARALLRRLRQTGLDTILVSISPFHNAFIPFSRVKRLMAACEAEGMGVLPWVMGFFRDVDHLDDQTPHPLPEYEAAFGPGYLARLPERYWIHLGGRALATFARVLGRRPTEQILAEATGGCGDLSRTDHFHIDLHGDYVPGMCPGLAVRHHDLGAPLSPETYPLLTRLHQGGVGALHALAVDLGFTPDPRGYLDRCHLCDQIRQHLVRRPGSPFDELRPRAFYASGGVEETGPVQPLSPTALS